MKKQRSRRSRALGQLAVLLVLVLAAHFLELFYFIPGTALRGRERELGIGRTETLLSAALDDRTVYLSGCEDRLLMAELRFNLLGGWRVNSSQLYRRDSSRDVQLEAYVSGNQDGTWLTLCGWVADEEIGELPLRLRCRSWYGDGEDLEVDLTVTSFQDWQGERVFLITSREVPARYTLEAVYLVTDQGETLLYQE